MNTAEMYLMANKTGAWYMLGQMFYNRSYGFVNVALEPLSTSSFSSIDNFMELSPWKSVEVMSRNEVEMKYGIIVMG